MLDSLSQYDWVFRSGPKSGRYVPNIDIFVASVFVTFQRISCNTSLYKCLVAIQSSADQVVSTAGRETMGSSGCKIGTRRGMPATG
jgi:hypothetical protein